MRHDDLYSVHAETIEAVIASVCRRHRLPTDEAEELASRIRFKIVDRDCDVLRRFAGRSSLRTYLVTVAERIVLDARRHEWGKWRPSQAARRLGPTAIALDRLLTRDGLPYEEAVETLLASGAALSRRELDDIRPHLPDRVKRFKVPVETLLAMPASGTLPEDALLTGEETRDAARTAAALSESLALLDPQDRLILRLRFQDGFTVARIAMLIGAAQKPLYRRFDRLFAHLREALSARGVTAAAIGALFDEAAPPSPDARAAASGIGSAGPSKWATPGGHRG